MTPDRGRQFILPAAMLIAVVLFFVAIHLLQDEPPKPPVQRGIEWILAMQDEDGAWRGREIAVLRPGPAMTAFVLYTLTRRPHVQFSDRLERAARYLESQTDETDYPNYTKSLTVLSFVALDRKNPVPRLVDALKRAQLDESEGWSPSDPEYGGWAFGGPSQPKPHAHRLDISMTRFALEALAAAGVPADDPVWARARRFLESCQNPDGGFIFTPLSGQNKAGERLSYGSATADGLLALQFAQGAPERIESARGWIQKNFRADQCPGFPPDHPRNWSDGLLGYWLAAASRNVDRKPAIKEALLDRQKPDGSWVNPSDLMLENEPLLATTLAVLALIYCEP
jgi:hypothetical protein